jgi:hypothetical protein
MEERGHATILMHWFPQLLSREYTGMNWQIQTFEFGYIMIRSLIDMKLKEYWLSHHLSLVAIIFLLSIIANGQMW